MIPDKTPYSRLRTKLVNSRIAVSNKALYETVLDLIKAAESFGDFTNIRYQNINSSTPLDLVEIIQRITDILNNINTNFVTGPALSVDSEIVLFSGVSGKIIKRATGTGFVKATAGVYSVVSDTGSGFAHTFLLMGA